MSDGNFTINVYSYFAHVIVNNQFFNVVKTPRSAVCLIIDILKSNEPNLTTLELQCNRAGKIFDKNEYYEILNDIYTHFRHCEQQEFSKAEVSGCILALLLNNLKNKRAAIFDNKENQVISFFNL